MSLCGLVLVFETKERERGRCASTRTSPHGLVLVFETRERGGARAPECAHVGTFWFSRRGGERRGARAPESAHMGTFWCSKRGRGRGNTRMCPQGHVLVFGMWRRAEWRTSQVSCGRQEWRVGAFSVEGNKLGLLEVKS